jgi:hypothetical protein
MRKSISLVNPLREQPLALKIPFQSHVREIRESCAIAAV